MKKNGFKMNQGRNSQLFWAQILQCVFHLRLLNLLNSTGYLSVEPSNHFQNLGAHLTGSLKRYDKELQLLQNTDQIYDFCSFALLHVPFIKLFSLILWFQTALCLQVL